MSCRRLLKKGAPTAVADKDGRTPLLLAAATGLYPVYKLFADLVASFPHSPWGGGSKGRG